MKKFLAKLRKGLSGLAPKLIRTWVPTGVGALIAWLVSLGVDVSAQAQTGLVIGGTGVLIAAYYGVVAALEQRWPWLSVLLGSTKQPTGYSRDRHG